MYLLQETHMGNANSVSVEISTIILQLLVKERAKVILPDSDVVYMDDKSLEGCESYEVLLFSNKFNPYGFLPSVQTARYLYKCWLPLTIELNMSRLRYKEEHHIINIIKFFESCMSTSQLREITNSIDALYVGEYIAVKILHDELNKKFDVPKYFESIDMSIFHKDLQSDKLEGTRNKFYKSNKGGSCNDEELSLKFANMIASSFGEIQLGSNSKPYIKVDTTKKAKIVKYFTEAVDKLRLARLAYYGKKYKEISINVSDEKCTFHEYSNGLNKIEI